MLSNAVILWLSHGDDCVLELLLSAFSLSRDLVPESPCPFPYFLTYTTLSSLQNLFPTQEPPLLSFASARYVPRYKSLHMLDLLCSSTVLGCNKISFLSHRGKAGRVSSALWQLNGRIWERRRRELQKKASLLPVSWTLPWHSGNCLEMISVSFGIAHV